MRRRILMFLRQLTPNVMPHTVPEIAYREITVDRIDEVRLLWEKLNAYHLELSPHLAKEIDCRTFDRRKQDLAAKANAGKIRIELVADDKRDIAYCVSSVLASGVAEVDSVFVDIQFRGSGIGTELMRRALAWFRAAGATSIVVSVMHGNDKALTFYQRFGFRPRAIIMKLSGENTAERG
jgi:diamine N-acetyltransferase